jgi:sulfite exporter TauE/SafE
LLDQLIKLGSQSNFYVLVIAIMIGLGGSLHCIGMCGPLVSATCSSKKQLALYQLGRLLGYLFLGIIAGAIGQYFIATHNQLLSKIFTYFLAFFFVFTGIRIFAQKPIHMKMPAFLQKIWQWSLGSKFLSFDTRSFLVGLFSIFLPCGFLYSIVFACVGFQSITLGFLSMFAFWLGTIPAMTFAPLILRKILEPLSFRHPYIAGSFFILLGVITVFWRYQFSLTHCPFCH